MQARALGVRGGQDLLATWEVELYQTETKQQVLRGLQPRELKWQGLGFTVRGPGTVAGLVILPCVRWDPIRAVVRVPAAASPKATGWLSAFASLKPEDI